MGTGKSAVKQKSWHQSRVLRNRILPRLVIAKRYGYDQCGILVPNCYFESVDEWERVMASIREANASSIPIEEKDPRCEMRFERAERGVPGVPWLRSCANCDARCCVRVIPWASEMELINSILVW